MRPSSFVFGLGLVLYLISSTLVNVGISEPILRAMLAPLCLVILAAFTGMAMFIIARGADEIIVIVLRLLLDQARREAKMKRSLRTRKKK